MKRRIMSLITSLALCLSLCPAGVLAADRDLGLCSHHPVHTEECGCIPGEADTLYVCRICPIQDLIDKLPYSVTPENKSQTEEQLKAILALYTELNADEQDQLDLSRCLDLQTQLDTANTPMPIADEIPITKHELTANRTLSQSFDVKTSLAYDVHEYSHTVTKAAAIVVQSTGELHLMGSQGGAVISQSGAGVEVQAGGTLFVEGLVSVTGTTYGLNVASGAAVHLSGGTFTGSTAAIQVADGGYADLLPENYAYFDANGNPIEATAVAGVKTVSIKAQPKISWNTASVTVDYTGREVEKTSLPVTVTAPEDLSQYVEYFYKEQSADDSAYVKGLPKNAGTYNVVARLPELPPNYSAASTGAITLTISKIPAVDTAPTAKTLTYNREPQELVTAGVLKPGAVAEGAVIEFARDQGGPYSTDIPTEITVSTYSIWYKVEETENYKGQSGQLSARINHKEVTPTVELEYSTTLYDGGEKRPTVTVKDGDAVIPNSEYSVTYSDNRDVSTDTKPAKVTVSNKANGNYIIKDVSVTFKITLLAQDALSITGQPNTFTYGDQFTLGTSGGSGNGAVTWEITKGRDTVAIVDKDSGQITIKGVGTATVQATKSGTDPQTNKKNYEDAIATWTFTSVKRPVVATVTAENKTYDGKVDATVKAVVEQGVVSGDVITISGLSGTFDDENVGTGKTVTVNGTVQVSGTNSGNYVVTLSSRSVKADITKATTSIKTFPGNTTLTYTGAAQPLVTVGKTNIDTIPLEYALSESGPYSTNIPKGTDAGKYEVWYRVKETDNYFGTAAANIEVTIAQKSFNTVTVELSFNTFVYDGQVHKPNVTVKDGTAVIGSDQYTVSWGNGDWTSAGTYTVTVTGTGKNYTSGSKTAPVDGKKAAQSALHITGQPNIVYYGDMIQLSTTGGTGNGTVAWSIVSGNDIVTAGRSAGQFKIIGVGKIEIKATRESADKNNYEDAEDTWEFYAYPKPASVTVELALPEGGYVYDSQAKKPVATVTADDGTTLSNVSDYIVGYSNNTDAGTAAVTVTAKTDGKYAFPVQTVNFTIAKGTAAYTTEPGEKTGLAYTGEAQQLVTGGTSNLGKILYSLDNSTFVENIPTGTNADTYTVWYRVEGTDNYTGIAAKSKTVTIDKATPSITPTEVTFASEQTLNEISLDAFTAEIDGVASVPGSFAWANGEVAPVAGQSYDVTFTPTDGDNYNTVTIQVTVTVTQPAESGGGGGSTEPVPDNTTTDEETGAVSIPMQASVSNGTATSVMSASAGRNLVKAAAANQSKNVIIKPEISSDVTKTEVSIPASTVSQLKSETDAALTVSTPVANVTIPNEALGTLSSAGGMVTATTEQEENTVTLTLTAGGETVERVPGGVTLTVPAEDAGPGTVAVLVHDDGTRETIRKSVAGDGEISIPLDGSATVEIVDNSKDFADVPAENWASDAVAFASAHELFNGTSKTTFSPDQPMSRGMLATVLYNLEGQPDQDAAVTFSDVDSDAWYAAGVSWAAENGITKGSGDGQFAPDQSITREQFAVMLWRYAGCPAADDQPLNFTDADKASSYAAEALQWAAAKGILKGYGDGQLKPDGLATRAQAAQMLKNFMENT